MYYKLIYVVAGVIVFLQPGRKPGLLQPAGLNMREKPTNMH